MDDDAAATMTFCYKIILLHRGYVPLVCIYIVIVNDMYIYQISV